MPILAVPFSFFRSERDSIYSDWHVSFWRELFSNSQDAGATQIKVRTAFADLRGNPVLRVIVHDNGSGMSMDTLTKVYMQLGESTKGDQINGVGGFGRARILTTFSHPRYSIATGNIVLDGEGVTYQTRESKKPVEGCAVIVDIELQHAARLQAGLFEFLEASEVPASLDLARALPDGTPMQCIDGAIEGKPVRWRSRFKPGNHISDFEDEAGIWAKISLSQRPGALAHKLLVRVNGLCMHTEYLSEPVQVTVDLVASRSRQAMTASRDSLHWEFRTSLMRFVQRIATDVVSASRPRKELSKISVPGRNGPLIVARQCPIETAEPGAQSVRVMSDNFSRGVTDRFVRSISSTNASPADHLANDFQLYIEDATAAQKEVANRYDPLSWGKGGSPVFYAQRLLAMWSEAIKLSVSRLQEQHDDLPDEILLRCGFVVGEFTGAKLELLEDGSYAALINPVDIDGKPRYRLSSAQDRKMISALAMHEGAHLVVDLHNEAFASALTNLHGSYRDIDFDRELQAAANVAGDMVKVRREGLEASL